MTMQQLIDRYGLWACYSGWAAWQRYGWDDDGWKTNKQDVHGLAVITEDRSPDLVRATITRSRLRQP